MFGVWDLPVEPKLQYKDNIYYMAKTAISKNDLGLTDTCGMSVVGAMGAQVLQKNRSTVRAL